MILLCFSAAIFGLVVWRFVPFIFGEEYRPAASSAVVLAAAHVLTAVFAHLSLPFNIAKSTSPIGVSVSIAAVVNVVACIFLTGKYGSLGAAWAMFLSQLVLVVIPFILVKIRYWKTLNFWQVFLPIGVLLLVILFSLSLG